MHHSQRSSVTGGGRSIDAKNVVNDRVGVIEGEELWVRTSCAVGWVSAWGQVDCSERTGMDGRARPFGSGLKLESTGTGCWAKRRRR